MRHSVSKSLGDPEHLYALGRAALAAGRFEYARDAFSRALDACPELLDDVAATFGRRADREGVLDVLEHRPATEASLGASLLAARLARDLGRLAAALGWAERAAKASGQSAAVWFELGEVHLALARTNQARAAFGRCLAIEPTHAGALARIPLCAPRNWNWVARGLARLGLVHRALRRIAWSGGRLAMLEAEGRSAAAHQMRWAMELERGSALALFPQPPREVEPPFAEHMAACNCPFWRWFVSLGIAGQIRTVLDIGCGSGFPTLHFAHSGFEVAGVTCNPHEKAECLRRGIPVLEDEFHFLSAVDDSYDMIFSSHSLEHSLSPLFALWEWKRAIRPGGYILIVVPLPLEQDARVAGFDHYDSASGFVNYARPAHKAASIEEVRTDHSAYGNPGHFFVPTFWQLRWLFDLAGLETAAAAVEDPAINQVLSTEPVDGRLPRDPNRPLNGLFLLRKGS